MEQKYKDEIDKKINEYGIDFVLNTLKRKRDLVFKLNVDNKKECTSEWLEYVIRKHRNTNIENIIND